MKILVVEDEVQLAEALSKILEKNKYVVDTVYDGESGLDYILSDVYDVVILDIMLPIKNGIDVLKEARKSGIKTPVILLTAKSDIRDKVVGLDSGADDYLSKPFATEELLARIRALSRRKSDNLIIDNTLKFKDISLNMDTLDITCNDMHIKVTLKEAQVLELLINQKGLIISKDTVINKLWGFDSDAEHNNVEVYVSFLRKKFAYLKSTVSIKAIRGVGYILE